MSNVHQFGDRKQGLIQKIGELESTLGQLRRQLELESQREQHAAIDRLEEYLGELDNRHASLQEFWKILREEIRELFSGGSSPRSGA